MLSRLKELSALLRSSDMQFDPVPVEDDELIQAIETEVQQRDNNWQLEERPDPERLIAFWQKVIKES